MDRDEASEAREIAIQADTEHATIGPLYATTEPGAPEAKHIICGYKDRQGNVCIDMFLVDGAKPIQEELASIAAVAGGGLFGELTFLYYMGKQ